MARLPIQQFSSFGDDLAPNFDLVINGKPANAASELFRAVRPLVQSVTFEDDEEMSSMFELTLINQPETSAGQPVDWRAVIDSKAFAEGNFIDLFMGYGNNREFIDRAEIVQWMPTFGPSGPTTFVIKGFDGRHRMQRGNQFKVGGKSRGKKKRKTYYRNTPDELIVKKIAEKYGYLVSYDIPEFTKKAVRTVKRTKDKAAVTAHHVFPTRVQGSDMSDWEFLQKLARINRFDLWVDFDQEKDKFVVHFAKRQDTGAPGYLFTYNGEDGSLIEAAPEFSISEQSTDVEVLVYDRKKRVIELTTISDQTKEEDVKLGGPRLGRGQLTAKTSIEVGARVRFTAFGQVHEAFSSIPFRSKKDASNFVKNWLKERERELMVLTGRVIGIPSLRSRQIHELRGLGKRIDGLYRFTNVKHSMNPGEPYNCEFVAHKVLSQEIARRKPTTKTEKASKTKTAAG